METMDVEQPGDTRLDETEMFLGEHVTGGVVQSWKKVQKKLQDILCEGKLCIKSSQGILCKLIFIFGLIRKPQKMKKSCLQVELLLVPTTTSSWLNWSQSWKKVSSSSDCISNFCRFDLKLFKTNVFVYKLDIIFLSFVGQPRLSSPPRAVGLVLFGRMGTSSDIMGRAESSEDYFWKRAAGFHWRCHSTEPWGKITKADSGCCGADADHCICGKFSYK